MAKAKVGPAGIEYIQGSLLKPKKQNGHSHGNYLIATHRTAPTESDQCQRLYSRPADTYKRTGTPSENEQLARLRFSTVSAAVLARSRDLSKVASDQAAFVAQKDQPYGKRTMKAYLWMVCGDAYDTEHQG